jgi:acetylornithine/succinyldiaminopimelate/putrescine aminotransferase
MIGAELDRPGPVAAACLDAGLLVGTAGDTVLRLTPPLTISGDEVDAGLSLLGEVLVNKVRTAGCDPEARRRATAFDAERRRRGTP